MADSMNRHEETDTLEKETDTLEKVRRVLTEKPIARSKEIEATGVNRSQISRLVAAGRLVRVSRGVYSLPDFIPGENAALAEVAKRVPRVVFCLLTALRFHELTTQSPFQVWIAIGSKDRAPRLSYPPLRVVRFSPRSLEEGVETHQVESVPVRVTSPAKTVADCFKFRSKVGLDVAIEALQDALRERKATVDELWHLAEVDRVQRVMRPYLEVLA